MKRFEEAKQLFLTLEDQQGVANCICDIGRLEQRRGEVDSEERPSKRRRRNCDTSAGSTICH
ncbi:hypothetical protein BT69DRAFT_527617 [Atractiella rhizophila]|nr:hypothetical protein BT69DRAFT_527617 [Atractiella rhizophila]